MFTIFDALHLRSQDPPSARPVHDSVLGGGSGSVCVEFCGTCVRGMKCKGETRKVEFMRTELMNKMVGQCPSLNKTQNGPNKRPKRKKSTGQKC